MKFQIASNWIFDERDLANHVLTASDRNFPKAWIFDCEAAARSAADRLNKAAAKHGCISAVACIINTQEIEMSTKAPNQLIRLTTAEGSSWTTKIASNISEEEAIAYFVDNSFDVSPDPGVEVFERVVSLEYNV